MITRDDIVSIAQSMGYTAGFARVPKHSHCAKTPEIIYVRVWRGKDSQRKRQIGDIAKLAQLSEEELRKTIESKVSKVEGRC